MSAYRPFGAPFLKVFLGAIFTYQVIYYVWMKLETSEKKLLKNGMSFSLLFSNVWIGWLMVFDGG
jgi:hypothetical protein